MRSSVSSIARSVRISYHLLVDNPHRTVFLDPVDLDHGLVALAAAAADDEGGGDDDSYCGGGDDGLVLD